MFLHPHTVTVRTGDAIGYSALLKFIEPTARSNPSLYPLLAFIILFLQAVILTGIINKHRMISRSNYFPGMAYLLITSLFPEWNYFSAPLLVNTILLIILSGLFTTYNQQNAKSTLFNVGLLLGVAAFIFSPSITFVAWILLALAVMRPFKLNEWLLCILGITTPFYFYAIYLFMVDQWSWQNLWPHFTVSLPSVQQSAWLAGSAFLLAVPFFTGGYYVQENLRKMLIQVRKGWSLMLLYLLGAIFIPFVNNSNSFENWVMAAMPFAAFHACTYFYATLRIVPLALFWVTVAFVLGYQYYGPGW
ncbi:MAG: hypothetical protein IPQ06_02885 [Chitinophagaceae bacterium]|nr:hypothetical protein [Chitinophagaceae bacterium]MBL0272032.1 hypothetical protein [Chitinophagaceae bacterium]